VVVAPGAGVRSLAPTLARRAGLRACRLQMLRTVPQPASFRLDAVLMSDLSLVRYEGFAALRPALGFVGSLGDDFVSGQVKELEPTLANIEGELTQLRAQFSQLLVPWP